jgi:hypothetical protein
MNIAFEAGVAGDTDRATLTNQVEALLARLNPNISLERRRDDRFAIPVLFRLTPLDADRQPIEDEALIVVGKNISRRGLSFYHERPIPHRRSLIALAEPGIGSFAAEIDVSWCRFTSPGWYESGGRLVRAVSGSFDPAGHAIEPADPAQSADFLDTAAQVAGA